MIAACAILIAEICFPATVDDIKFTYSTIAATASAETSLAKIHLAYKFDGIGGWDLAKFAKECSEGVCVYYWRYCSAATCKYTISWQNGAYVELTLAGASIDDVEKQAALMAVYPSPSRHDSCIGLERFAVVQTADKPPRINVMHAGPYRTRLPASP